MGDLFRGRAHICPNGTREVSIDPAYDTAKKMKRRVPNSLYRMLQREFGDTVDIYEF